MPPTDEITGQHPLPIAAPQPNGSKLASIMLAAALTFLGGAGSGYVGGAAREAATDARSDQRVTELERRTAALEEQRDGVESLRREVAALSATVTTQNAAFRLQLQRIEDAVDNRERSRN